MTRKRENKKEEISVSKQNKQSSQASSEATQSSAYTHKIMQTHSCTSTAHARCQLPVPDPHAPPPPSFFLLLLATPGGQSPGVSTNMHTFLQQDISSNDFMREPLDSSQLKYSCTCGSYYDDYDITVKFLIS